MNNTFRSIMLLFTSTLLWVQTILAQPAIDSCAGAIPVTPDGTFVSVNATDFNITTGTFTSEVLLDGVPKAKEGTYQFIFSSKRKIAYTNEQMDVLLKLIEQERLDTNDLTLSLNDYVSVYIPSKSKILNKNFSLLFEVK